MKTHTMNPSFISGWVSPTRPDARDHLPHKSRTSTYPYKRQEEGRDGWRRGAAVEAPSLPPKEENETGQGK